MKTGILLLLSLISAAQAEESRLLDCPQCGNWQVSYSPHAAFQGEVVKVDGNSISIPNCGTFSYTVEKNTVTQEPAAASDKYDLQLVLKANWENEICQIQKDQLLTMRMEVSGHSQNGGTASFKLPAVFSAEAWNTEREQPGDAGSAYGSTSAASIEFARIYSALSREAASAYERSLTSRSASTPASFNPLRFSAETMSFCRAQERKNGMGGWPSFWANLCQNERLETKLRQFMMWTECMDAKSSTRSVARCVFPSEKFDRSPKQEQ